MRTFAQEPPSGRRGMSAQPSTSGAGHLEHDAAVGSILDSLPQADDRGAETDATEPASPRLGHDFRHVPLHRRPADAEQTNMVSSGAGDELEQEAERISENVDGATPLRPAIGGGHPHGQRFPRRSDERSDAVPTSVRRVLASPGTPLSPTLQQHMEDRFGCDFSRVRLHSDHAAEHSAAEVDAQAYTVGNDIVFGAPGPAPATQQGRRLIAHELTHVVQQSSSPSEPGLTHALQRRPAGSGSKVRERVVGREEGAERSRTIVKIEVVGHASPRWRTATTPRMADDQNWRLAEQRAKSVRSEIERLLHDLLPDQDLVFAYRFTPSTDLPDVEPVRALDEETDVSVDFRGQGSTETLAEAGERGRKANDAPMRRVDVKVTLHSHGSTAVEEDVERSERKSGATRHWSMWITGEAGVEAVGKAGAILIQLRNEKTRVVGTYAGWASGAGASIGVNIAKTSPASFESFTTPVPMTFAEFSGSNFSIASAGVSVGAFGAEWSKFRFDQFPGGQPTPGGIQVGGLTFGGIEVNFGSVVYGAMFLTDDPAEDYTEITQTKRTQTYDAFSAESSGRRVLFATGADEVTAWESDLLHEYLIDVVHRSGF